ncbi:MAG TPA: choice-of-anchor L domain-containing protein, partial [Bacteroidales bacterium]|nr:choice-of-anchor L domain-containing protein [Bacteroidales bacterium]
VSFRYTFASEEYNEWVGSTYNDAFGFFLTGGPENYNSKNIALIPGTSTPVTINNVNHGHADSGCGPGPGTNPSYFRDNACTVSGSYPYKIECDGLTTVLTATAAVTPCKWYHIKLVVADVSDGIYDSWVFLEANSFSSGSGVAMSVANPTGTKHSYEGCTSSITFTRTDTVDTSAPINVSYSMGGTTTSGTDYTAPQNPVTIPIGVNSVTIPLYTNSDGVTEGIESIIITVTAGGCPCNPDIIKDTIFLHDFVGVSAHIQEADQSICNGASVTLHGVVTAGNYYQYSWSSSGGMATVHTQNITVSPTSTTYYYLLVRDSCENVARDTVRITVNTFSSIPTSATATPSTICNGESTTLAVVGGSLGTGATWHWYSSSCGGTAVGTGSSISVSPTTSTTYYVRAEGTCNTTSCVNVLVTVNPPATVNAGSDITICASATATLTGSIGGGASSATWSGGTGTYNPNNTTLNAVYTPSAAEITAGTVTLTLTTNDPTGPCPAVYDNVKIIIYPVPTIDAGDNQTICKGSTVTLAGTIGGAATSATWSGGTGSFNPNANTLNAVYTPSTAEANAGTVTLTLTTNDPSGPCTALSDNMTITINPIPTVEASANQTICAGYTVTLAGSVGGAASSGTWSGGTGNFNPNASTLNAIYTPSTAEINAGTVTLTLTTNDPSGPCSAVSDNMTITINPLPIAYNVTGGGEYCSGGIGLPICISSSQNGISYQLQYNGANTGLPIAGTGSALCFPNQTAAGTYTVIATNTTTSCQNNMTGNAVIVINPLPVANAGLDFSIPNGTNTTLSGSATNGSVPYTYSWTPTDSLVDPNIQNPVTTNLNFTTVFTLNVADIKGCTSSDQVVVTITGGPLTVSSVSATPNEICFGDSAQIAAFASGGSGTYTYSWLSNPTGFVDSTQSPFVHPDTTTTYIVTANDGWNNAYDSVMVIVNPLPIAYIVSGSGSYCAGGTGLDVCLSFSDIGISYQLQFNGVNIGTPLMGNDSFLCFENQTNAGVYTVIATDTATHCVNTMTGTATITINPNPVVNAGTDITIPYGTTTTLNGSATGGSGNYLYFWTPADSVINANITNPLTTNLNATTTFTLTVIDKATGCIGTDDVVITVVGHPINIIALNASPNAICYGDSTLLNAIADGGSGVYTYSWLSNPSGFVDSTQSPMVHPLDTTTYIVTADDGYNTISDSITIIVNPLPILYNVTVSDNGVYCASEPGVLVGLNNSEINVEYELYFNGTSTGLNIAGTGSVISFGYQTAGTYLIIATNTITHCTDTMNGFANIIVNPLPVTYNLSGSGEYCLSGSGVTLTLSGSQLGVNYTLYLNGAPTNIDTLGTGSAINFPDQPTGNYTIIATDTLTHCVDTMNGIANVVVNPLPTIYNLSGSGSYCASGSGVTLTLSGSQLGVNYTLYLNGSPTNIDTLGTGSAINFNNQPAGVYMIVATDISHTTLCTDTMSGIATVTVNPLPIAYDLTAAGNGEYCASYPGVALQLSGSQVGVNYTLYLNGNNTNIVISGTGSAISFPEQPAGTYTVIAEYVSPNTHCSDTMNGEATIIVNPLPEKFNLFPTNAQYCASDSGVEIGLDGSQLNVQYVLFVNGIPTGETLMGTGDTISFGIQPAGTYIVIATDTITTCQNNMTGSSTITINPLPNPYDINPSGTTQYCTGGTGITVLLSDSDPGVDYMLYLNGVSTGIHVAGTGSPISFGNQLSGDYIIIATNIATDCKDTMNGFANITVFSNPPIDAGDDTSICAGSSAVLNANIGTSYEYLWNPSTGLSATNISNPTSTPSSTTTYYLTITDSNGCTASDQVTITVVDIPVVTSLSSDLTTDFGYIGNNIIITANPDGYDTYQFYVDGNLEQNSPSNVYETSTLTGTQTIYVIAEEGGCLSATDSLIIKIKSIPNAFTPDGDGINDLFAKGLDLTIINRWGQSLFEGKDGWDGKYEGKLVAAGTYFYIIKLYDKNENITELKGSVNVAGK